MMVHDKNGEAKPVGPDKYKNMNRYEYKQKNIQEYKDEKNIKM